MNNFPTVSFLENSFETVEQTILSRQHRFFRASVTMIGLAISVGTTVGFLPQFQAPATAKSSLTLEDSLLRKARESALTLPQIITGHTSSSLQAIPKVSSESIIINTSSNREISEKSAELSESLANWSPIISRNDKAEKLWPGSIKASSIETNLAMAEAKNTLNSPDSVSSIKVVNQVKFEQKGQNFSVLVENKFSNQGDSPQIPVPIAVKKDRNKSDSEPVVLVTREFKGKNSGKSTKTVITPEQISEPIVITRVVNSLTLYQVKPGDTLKKIADFHQVSLKAIMKANQISNPNLIKVNQELKIPSNQLQSQEELNKQTQASISPYIKKLKADIAKLRQNYNLPENSRKIARGINSRTVIVSKNKISESLTRVLNNQAKQTVKEVIVDSRKDQQRNSILNVQVEDKREDVQSFLPENAMIPRDTTPVPKKKTIATSNPPGPLDDLSFQMPVSIIFDPSLPPLSPPEEYLPQKPIFKGYIWPARGVMTSGYGPRWGRMHRGIDIAGPIGTPIVAVADGEVITAGWNSGGYGNLVKLKHNNGTVTVYAHNQRILVRRGQQVTQGQQIAEMGSTGRSTGPHLHFEMHPKGSGAVNPMAYLPKKP